jgi:hypothetical protein
MSKEQLMEALRKFYSNTSLERSETRDGLEEAREEIETLLETLQDED